MTFYKITDGAVAESGTLTVPSDNADLFVICRAAEAQALLDVFHWDKSALLECTNLDETVRYTSYGGYDFISLIYADAEEGGLPLREINLFFSERYLVLIVPDSMGTRLARLTDGLRKAALSAAARRQPLVHLYYVILNGLVADFSETLEALEDEVEALAETILEKTCGDQLTEIARLRKTAYTYKKMLRAMSYIGEQILIDENELLDDGHIRYFRSIGARFMKQYDFAESLFDLSSGLLHTYDSKFSARTNETMNKLAAITLIFSPLTIITGVYGMNFINMPELRWAFGYPFALGIMGAVGAAIFLIMKKKKWL